MTTKAEAARAAVERLANVQMNISLAEWSELSSTILAALAKPASSPAAERIADAVLTWMIERDLLDAGNEYDAPDVLAVLNDLVDATPPASSAAGGGVVELVAAIIDPEIWAIEQPIPTRGHVEDFHQRRRSSCELAQRIIAALSQSTSAGRVGE